ncbi:MAG: chemotaxis protein CheX [Halanaerobiales bacterium]
MNLSEYIIESCSSTFPLFGYSLEFLSESSEENLNSAEEVNVLIGLSNGLQGNIVISFSKAVAMEIISTMMGGMRIENIDSMARSALGEMANMLMGSTVSSTPTELVIELSPPTIVIGNDMYIMISNIPAKKLVFKVASHYLYISYAIQ